MREDDEILSPPVGTYRTIWAGGGVGNPPLTMEKPYYAKRHHTLTNPMIPKDQRRTTQILIPALGQLMWVNIHPADIIT